MKALALVSYPDGKRAGDYTVGLPGNAEAQVSASAPFLCGERLVDYTIEVAGPALPVERG